MAGDSQYLNQTQAARVYQCDPKAIRNAMSKGKALHAATVERNGRRYVNMNHRAAKAYRAEYRIADPDEAARTVEPSARGEETPADIPEEIRECWSWTLEDIIRKCGTRQAFAHLLAAADKIESIHSKRLDSDKKTGDLISREFVQKHVVGLIERVFQRLLTDAPVKLSYEVFGLCETGATVEQVQDAIKAGLSRELKTIKRDTAKALKK